MWAIIGLTGFFGFFVCLVLLIVRAFKGEPKRPMVLGIFACIVLFAIGVSLTPDSGKGGKEHGETDALSSQSVETREEEDETLREKESNEPIQAETHEPDAEPTIAPSENQLMSLDALAQIFETLLLESYSGGNAFADESGITVNIWSDGLAMALAATQAAGGGADNEDWVFAKNATVSMASGLRDTMDTAGHSSAVLVVNVLNDQNYDNVLLSIINTTIVYDVLA